MAFFLVDLKNGVDRFYPSTPPVIKVNLIATRKHVGYPSPFPWLILLPILESIAEALTLVFEHVSVLTWLNLARLDTGHD